MSHPNATASVLSGGTAGLILYVLGRVGINGLTPADGAAIAAGLTAFVLFVGRRGIRGTLSAIWNGTGPGVDSGHRPR